MEQPKKASQRTCVIGLDGATFDILDQWIESGAMPHLESLINRGSRGILTSTMPPVTGPAWTSISTGVNPAMHGVFDFFKWSSDGMKARFVRSYDVKTPRIWDIAGQYNRSVCITNFPLAYPAAKLNGIMLTGMLTPAPGPQMTYPPELFQELKENKLLPADVLVRDGSDRRVIERAVRYHQRTRNIMRFLLKKGLPDLFFGVIMELDRVQHRLWPHCDLEQNPSNPGMKRLMEKFFREIDETIGMLLDSFGAETDFFIISDHGFGPVHYKLRVNKFLADQGFLHYDTKRIDRRYPLAKIDSIAVRIAGAMGVRKYIRQLKQKLLSGNARPTGWGANDMTVMAESIDWNRTRACLKSHSDCGIYVNAPGDEDGEEANEVARREIIEEVIRAIKGLKHPETGECLATRIERKENIMQGDYIKDAPDIYVTFGEGTIEPSPAFKGPLIEKNWKTGTHRMEGIFIAAGPGIQSGKNAESGVLDMAPTILYSMNIPIPLHMEGRIPAEIFTMKRLEKQPIRYGEQEKIQKEADSGKTSYTEQEEQMVQERLKDLGYL